MIKEKKYDREYKRKLRKNEDYLRKQKESNKNWQEKNKNNTEFILKKRLHGILGRCRNSKHEAYERYKNFEIEQRWVDNPQTFVDWAIKSGLRKELDIDRIDNKKGYLESNCRWVSRKENNRNRASNHLLELDGQKKTIAEWSDITGLKRSTIFMRIARGWSTKKTLTEEI